MRKQKDLGLINLFIIAAVLYCCRSPLKKAVLKFKDGSPALVYDYPDKSDTSTYTYLEYYPNGILHKKIPIQNNHIVNFPTWYYSNSKIYEIDSLIQPGDRTGYRWNGITTRYYENGVKWAVSAVRDGYKQGPTKVFDSNGYLLKQYNLTNDSIKSGAYVEFYPSGNISVKATFENNLPEGMMYFFGDNGDTSKYYRCIKGEIYMPYKKWLANGEILEGGYIDSSGQKVLWRWYSKSGELIKQELKYSKTRTFASPE